MSIEERIRNLSEAIIACTEESKIVILTQDLQNAIHEHIEYLRAKLLEIPAVIEKNIDAA